MLSYYCLKCRKNTEGKDAKVEKTMMLLSECVVCDSTKSKFIKDKKLVDY